MICIMTPYEIEGRARFWNDCVHWPAHDVQHLIDIMDRARQIKLATFRRHVNWSCFTMIRTRLGYAWGHQPGLRLEDDYHVTYWRSKDNEGHPVFIMQHSAIEYCFH